MATGTQLIAHRAAIVVLAVLVLVLGYWLYFPETRKAAIERMSQRIVELRAHSAKDLNEAKTLEGKVERLGGTLPPHPESFFEELGDAGERREAELYGKK